MRGYKREFIELALELGVHPYVVILGAAHVVSQLQFGWSTMNVRFGERNDITGRNSGGGLEGGRAR